MKSVSALKSLEILIHGASYAIDLTMKKNLNTAAFTLVDLIVVIVILVVVFIFLWMAGLRAKPRHHGGPRIRCINNLKQIGTAYRIWENDHGNRFPAMTPEPEGWSNLLASGVAGRRPWVNYRLMSNECGQAPAILVCPSDERTSARSFSNMIDNENISYFVGVNATDSDPQSILSGDRNLGPGTIPDSGYGYSPADGRGNDVTIKGPLCWSLKMHSAGNPAGAGNILLGDGSAQEITSLNLNAVWLKAATNSGPQRFIFP